MLAPPHDDETVGELQLIDDNSGLHTGGIASAAIAYLFRENQLFGDTSIALLDHHELVGPRAVSPRFEDCLGDLLDGFMPL